MAEHVNCGNPDQHTAEFCEAYDMLYRHAERMGLAEGAAQYDAHIKAGRKASTFGTGRRYPFIPSATLQTAVKMMGDPGLTKETVVAFLHDPVAHSWDTEHRMRNTG
jgi:hypothetical protein